MDPTLLAEQGLPFYAGTWVVQLLSTNLGMAATFTHLLLWNYSDMRVAWEWLAPSRLRVSLSTFNWRFWEHDNEEARMRKYEEAKEDKNLDPHYREMLKYEDAPNSWYAVTLILSTIISLVVIYKANSTLPWWGFFISFAIFATLEKQLNFARSGYRRFASSRGKILANCQQPYT